jgi:hypothetical protein
MLFWAWKWLNLLTFDPRNTGHLLQCNFRFRHSECSFKWSMKHETWTESAGLWVIWTLPSQGLCEWSLTDVRSTEAKQGWFWTPFLGCAWGAVQYVMKWRRGCCICIVDGREGDTQQLRPSYDTIFTLQPLYPLVAQIKNVTLRVVLYWWES